MKKLILLTIGLLLMSTGFAQKPVEDDYAQQYTKLHRKYSQDTCNVVTLVALADFYSDSINPMFNLPKAIKYIDSAVVNFIRIVEDNDRYKEARKIIKGGITVSDIKNKKLSILSAARHYVTTTESINENELNNFATAFASDPATLLAIERQRIQSEWKSTKRLNTIEGYLTFQKQYPNTSEAELAEGEIKQLAQKMFATCENDNDVDRLLTPYNNLPIVKSAATQQKAHLSFLTAEKINTIESYRKYMQQYPSGDDYQTAMNRVGDLMVARFSSLTTAQELVDFVLFNNDNPMADQAMEKLRNMILDNQDVYALQLYLKNFPLDPAYNDIYQQYYDWHTFEGDLAPIQDFAKANPDFPYQVAIQRDLKLAEERSNIDLTKPYVSTDFDQYASYLRRLTGTGLAFVTLQRIMQPMIARKDWKGALDKMDYFMLSFESNDVERYQGLRKMLQKPIDKNRLIAVEVTPSYNMTHPIINENGTLLYFTKVVGNTSVIWTAEKVYGKSYKWKSTAPITFKNDQNENITLYCLYDNETKMLVGRNGDIMMATLEGSEWVMQKPYGNPINTPYIETDAFMLPDGSGMLLASDRPYGHNFHRSGSLFHGDTALALDIYFIPYTAEGWGTPINLGMNINGNYCECSPVLSKDLRTLYFISDGGTGFGYGDIFKTYRDDITDWTHWQQPENLGKEVNSGFREASITISGDDQKLIISSDRKNNSFGCYSLAVQHEKGADMVQINVDGRVFGDQLKYMAIVDMVTNSLVQVLDIEMPVAEVNLYSDRNYAIVAEVNGKYFPPMVFSPTESNMVKPGEPYSASLLTATQKEVAIRTIAFNENSKTPYTHSIEELQRLGRFLKDNPDTRVELNINVKGEDDLSCYNLSLNRGKEVKKIIVSVGANEDQISISAFGNVNYKDNPKTSQVVARFKKF